MGELTETATPAKRRWWEQAVFYEVYVRSFADADGDGVGDLEGIRQHLDHLEDLGVDGVWLTPFYRSPMVDHGYDVADPRDVDPLFGDLAAFDRLVAALHERGLRLTVDLVPNHVSDQHPWFQAALRAKPGSPERARFIFRDGRGPDGVLPPNNWPSVFGGPAWTRVPDGQWYLHLFAAEQPDLNWENPEVAADLERTLRFWLDRGVDGFRIDVAMGLAKPLGLPDMPNEVLEAIRSQGTEVAGDVRFDADEVHTHMQAIRTVLDGYDERMAVGEVWVPGDERRARYVRPGELHLAFNFTLTRCPWELAALRKAVDDSLAAMAAVKAPTTWTLSNHDVGRQVTRYGGGELGRRRARAAILVELALPGVVYLYQGEELGLEDVDLPPAAMQDPMWRRTNGQRSRDGCRVPLPWSGEQPPYGFCPPGVRPWLPMPEGWADFTVAAQRRDPASMLALYREALRLRRKLLDAEPPTLEWLPPPAGSGAGAAQDVLVFRRGALECWVNFGSSPVPLPGAASGAEVLLASVAPEAGPDGQVALPADAAAWLRRRAGA
jgi:alpha-glucosidase